MNNTFYKMMMVSLKEVCFKNRSVIHHLQSIIHHSTFILLLFAFFLSAADWPTFRGNMQRTGYYPDPVGFPKEKATWTVKIGCELISSPSIEHGILYIGGRDSCLYALEASNGKILWKKKTNGWVDSSPLLHKGNVYIGSRDGFMYEYDNLGNDIAQLKSGLQLSSPAVSANGAILASIGSPLSIFSAYGAIGWGLGKADAVWSVPLSQISYSSPSVFGQVVVIGTVDGMFYGIDTETKKSIWTYKTDGGVYMSSAAIDKDNLIAYFAPGNDDRNIYALNLLDGSLLWASEGAASQSLNKKLSAASIMPGKLSDLVRLNPAFRKQQLLQSSGNLTKMVLKSQKSRAAGQWYFLGDMKTSSVALCPEKVYVVQKALGVIEKQTSAGIEYEYKPQFSLIAMDKNSGKEIWRFSEKRQCIPIGYCSSPVVTSTAVYCGWGEGMLYAFNKKTGEKLWADTLDADIISSPSIADGMLYVATIAGTVYKYMLSETQAGIDFKRSTYCYPNPAAGPESHIQIYPEHNGILTMTIYTMADKPVLHVNHAVPGGLKDVTTWNLANVANGAYIARIRIKYEDGTEDKKVLKIAILK